MGARKKGFKPKRITAAGIKFIKGNYKAARDFGYSAEDSKKWAVYQLLRKRNDVVSVSCPTLRQTGYKDMDPAMYDQLLKMAPDAGKDLTWCQQIKQHIKKRLRYGDAHVGVIGILRDCVIDYVVQETGAQFRVGYEVCPPGLEEVGKLLVEMYRHDPKGFDPHDTLWGLVNMPCSEEWFVLNLLDLSGHGCNFFTATFEEWVVKEAKQWLRSSMQTGPTKRLPRPVEFHEWAADVRAAIWYDPHRETNYHTVRQDRPGDTVYPRLAEFLRQLHQGHYYTNMTEGAFNEICKHDSRR